MGWLNHGHWTSKAAPVEKKPILEIAEKRRTLRKHER